MPHPLSDPRYFVGVLVAGVWNIRRVYPNAVLPAIEHLIWALQRTERDVNHDGPTAATTSAFRADLAGYRGPYRDFVPFNIPEILAALASGDRADVEDTLDRLGLLRPIGGRAARGPARAAS